ncbi:hypothetical protein B0E45_06040 [Sinorhizobium sp. A49]|uniref:hypothetical protein n=1 Tax=Sinorhizobium sp. A49 TaxID=1945861 RepID=UPI000986654C|nr:hypothetical protein [Sinorhizobium sp. A49]OOG73852.1 hypothetical protein B0E45_06040 [Sinorhizobium sp. A49]
MPHEVTEFVIVPPVDQRPQIHGAKERFVDYLVRRFPGYAFKVSSVAPVGEMDCYMIYPIMNFLGPDGQSYMCTKPPAWLLGEISRACDDFDVERSFAA